MRYIPLLIITIFASLQASALDEATITQNAVNQHLDGINSIKSIATTNLEEQIKSSKLVQTAREKQQELVKQYDFGKRAEVLVFVSSSMGERTILSLMNQAHDINASVNLNGLVDNDFTKTVGFIQSLVTKNNNQGGINIDPESFSEYGIDKVPAIVRVNSNNDFDVIYGLGSINAAINRFEEKL